MDKGRAMGFIYLDFCKTFDTIPHNALGLFKLPPAVGDILLLLKANVCTGCNSEDFNSG